jgi:hypothetical protein
MFQSIGIGNAHYNLEKGMMLKSMTASKWTGKIKLTVYDSLSKVTIFID